MANQETEAFKTRVLFVLAHLEEGDITSYGELARQAGNARYARLVGQILKKLPSDTHLPWYRVVNSQHRISFTEGTDTYARQKVKLEQEGWIVVGQKLMQKEAP